MQHIKSNQNHTEMNRGNYKKLIGTQVEIKSNCVFWDYRGQNEA